MRLVIFEGNEPATVERGQPLVNVGLHSCRIVGHIFLALRKFGDAFAEKLARRRFDRSEVAAGDTALKPSFLIGMKGDWHVCLHHKSRPVSTVKSGFLSATEFCNRKA